MFPALEYQRIPPKAWWKGSTAKLTNGPVTLKGPLEITLTAPQGTEWGVGPDWCPLWWRWLPLSVCHAALWHDLACKALWATGGYALADALFRQAIRYYGGVILTAWAAWFTVAPFGTARDFILMKRIQRALRDAPPPRRKPRRS